MLTPIEKVSLSSEVSNRIRSSIFNGSLIPGQKLLEQELSEKMNTSRGPIREAFVLLEHEGLVIRQPNRSVIVVEMKETDVEEIHSIRLLLKLLTLRYLCDSNFIVNSGQWQKLSLDCVRASQTARPSKRLFGTIWTFTKK